MAYGFVLQKVKPFVCGNPVVIHKVFISYCQGSAGQKMGSNGKKWSW